MAAADLMDRVQAANAGPVGGLQPFQRAAPAPIPAPAAAPAPPALGLHPHLTALNAAMHTAYPQPAPTPGAAGPAAPAVQATNPGAAAPAPANPIAALTSGAASGAAPAGVQGTVQGFIDSLLRGGNAAGAFGPSYLTNLLRRQALIRSLNQQHQAGTFGSLIGLDPYSMQGALERGGEGAQNDLSNSLNEASIQGGQSYQQLLEHLLGGASGEEQQFQEQQHQAELNKQPNPFWGALGGAIGRGAIGLIPGLGPAAGIAAGTKGVQQFLGG